MRPFEGTVSSREVDPLGTAAAPKVAPGAKVGGRGRGVPPLAGAGLYMRARRYRRCTHARARETGNKTHHGPPVAPPDRAWCVLFRVSLAHVAMYHRCCGLRSHATDRKSAILVVPRGARESDHFCIFLGQQKNRGAVVIAWTVLWT